MTTVPPVGDDKGVAGARGTAMTAPYSQDELEVLMREGESDRVERKRSASDRSGIRRNVCAFANDLPGRGALGVSLVGNPPPAFDFQPAQVTVTLRPAG